MRVRLTKKFAECVNGVNLARRRVGDVFELEDSEAERLIDVGWATTEIERRRGPGHPFSGAERRKRHQPRR
jgi:hypothetical protein